MSQHSSDPSDMDDSDVMPDEMEYTILDTSKARESNDKVERLLPRDTAEERIPTRGKNNPMVYTTTSQSLDSPRRMNNGLS